MVTIDNLKKIHFVGIGGIGVSALAYFFLKSGREITGSDLFSSEITDRLKKEGASIYIGSHQKASLSSAADLVVHSPAVTPNNPEIRRAKSLKIPVFSYPEVLGELTKKYQTIAVSGSHGKSTTTSLIGLLLIALRIDPTIIVGTTLKEFGDLNCRVGKGKTFVIEADEFAGSFLNYWPKIALITNIEKEHMDYFKTEKRIIDIYSKYLDNVRKNEGILIANKDMYRNNTSKNNLYQEASYVIYRKVIDGFRKKGGECIFYSVDMLGKNGFPALRELKAILHIPGEHNISNACAALMAAKALGVSSYPIRRAWGKFNGAWRRFEILNQLPIKNYQSPVFISDYAHHPTEIRVTLRAAREKFGDKKRIICVYQPHQYQRTHYLFKDFTGAFDLSDALVLLDIYSVAGRETSALKRKVNSQKLAEAIKKRITVAWHSKEKNVFIKAVECAGSMNDAFEFLKNGDNVKGAVVLIMGAGDIIKLADRVKNEILN